MKAKQLIITIILALALTSCGDTLIGKPAPNFGGTVINTTESTFKLGDQFTLSKQSGKPIILYFFASW